MALFPSALGRCAPYPLHEWALRVLIEAMARRAEVATSKDVDQRLRQDCDG